MVVVAPLAIDLLVIVACLGALAILLSAKYLAQALVSIVRKVAGRLPLIGRLFAAGADYVERKIVDSLSDAINGTEGVIGAFWHAAGNLLASIGHELYGLAVALDRFGAYIHGVVRPWVIRTTVGGLTHGLKWLRHELTSTTTQVYRITKVVTHPERTAIGAAVRTITRPLAGELAHLERWTRARIAGAEAAIEGVLQPEIDWLRSRTGSLERFYERLWKQVRKLDRLTAASVFAGAVAIALARLGFGWLACRNWKRVGRSVCRMPTHLLDDALSLLTDFVVLSSICQVIPLLETGFADVASPLIDALTVAGSALRCGGGLENETLAVPALHLPPVAGLTLHLP